MTNFDPEYQSVLECYAAGDELRKPPPLDTNPLAYGKSLPGVQYIAKSFNKSPLEVLHDLYEIVIGRDANRTTGKGGKSNMGNVGGVPIRPKTTGTGSTTYNRPRPH